MYISIEKFSNKNLVHQNQKINYNSNPITEKRNYNSELLREQFYDYQVLFKAKQPITVKLEADKNKLLKTLKDILSTNIRQLSDEERAIAIMRKAMAMFEQKNRRLEELNFHAEAIANNNFLSPQQRLNQIQEIEKKAKYLEKNLYKLPKEEEPKVLEDMDYSLINRFKNAISNNNFNLRQEFLDHYSELETITTVDELKKKYPKIKVPNDPMENVVKKSTDVLTRDFYEDLDEKIESTMDSIEISKFLEHRLRNLMSNVAQSLKITSRPVLEKFIVSLTNKILKNYEHYKFSVGFSYIPENRKQAFPSFNDAERKLLNVDYDKFVLSVIKQQYLEGKKLSDIEYEENGTKIKISELKTTEFKFEKVPEKIKKIISDAEKLHKTQRDYKNYNLDELKARLNYYANTDLGNIEKIFDLIVDFDSCQNTPEDMRFMVKFIRELDAIKESQMSEEEAIQSIVDKNLKPIGTEKLNQIERENAKKKMQEKQRQAYELNQHRERFDEAISLLYQENMGPAAEVCSKYAPKTLDEKELTKSKKVIELINKGVSKNLSTQQFEALIMQWEAYMKEVENPTKSEIFNLAENFARDYDKDERETKIGQYLWNSEIVDKYPKTKDIFPNPELLEKLMEKSGFNNDTKTKLLCKYEDYMSLKPSDKASILKICEIFDYKNNSDRFLLKNIVEDEYANTDTIVYVKSEFNKTEQTPRSIMSNAKKQLINKYMFPNCLEFLIAFEEALPLDAKAIGYSGVKKLGRSNDKLRYKTELKIMGHDDRLFSSQNNYNFDIFSNTGMH